MPARLFRDTVGPCLYLRKRAKGGKDEGIDNTYIYNLSLADSMLLLHAAAARCNMPQYYAHLNTSLRVHVPEVANGASQRDYYPFYHLSMLWCRAHGNEDGV